MQTEELFFKLIYEEVDAFGKCIHEDVNKGTLEDVHEFLKKNILKHPFAKWELYPMRRCIWKYDFREPYGEYGSFFCWI